MEITDRQEHILKQLIFGLLRSDLVDEWVNKSGSEGPRDPQKQTKVCLESKKFRAEIIKVVEKIDVEPISVLSEQLLIFARSTTQPILRPKLLMVARNLSPYFVHNILSDCHTHAARAKKAKTKLLELVDRAEAQSLAQLDKYQMRDRRKRILRPLLRNGLISAKKVNPKLHNLFGDSAYFLTSDGAKFVQEHIYKGSLPIEFIRAYKFTDSAVRHEIMVADTIRSAFFSRYKLRYKANNVWDEPGLRRYYRSTNNQETTYPDLYITFSLNDQIQGFFIEIDTGSQPATVNQKRAEIYKRFILICSNQEVALRRRNELLMNDMVGTDWLITTYERICHRGIFEAGFWSKAKSQPCQCTRLINSEESAAGRKYCDINGCPCILSFFCSGLRAKVKQVQVKESTRTETQTGGTLGKQIEDIDHAEDVVGNNVRILQVSNRMSTREWASVTLSLAAAILCVYCLFR